MRARTRFQRAIASLSWAPGCGLVAALLLSVKVTSAQIPGLPPFGQARDRASSPIQPAPANTDAPDEPKSRVDKLLADVRADPDLQPPPPPEGVTDDEVAAQRNALGTLIHGYDQRAYIATELARLRKVRTDAKSADRAWTGLAAPPPYSILEVDEWRDAAELLRAHIAVLDAAAPRKAP